MDDEHAQVEAWRSGDKEAAAAVFERHFDAVYRFFRSKADLQDVDDLVQKTFLGLMKSRDSYSQRSSVRTYLLAIARNRLHDYWKARSRNRELDFLASSIDDLGPSHQALVLKNQNDRALLEALRRIPVDMQIVLELHYWEDMRGPALAEVLEIPEGTVRSRLRRGLEALRRELQALADSGDPLASTDTDLDSWAEALRVRVVPLRDAS